MRRRERMIPIKSKPWTRKLKSECPQFANGLTASTILPPRGCALIFPSPPLPPPPINLLKVDTFQYIAICDGIRTTYTNADALLQYGSSDILDPATVSYINLFINGVIQPLISYEVSIGLLEIKGIPEEGVPITLQFIRIYGSTS